MTETIIPKSTRFVTIKRFCEIAGVSYPTAIHLMDSGQIPFVTTESGRRMVDTGAPSDNNAIIERLDRNEKMLAALCRQFNVVVEEEKAWNKLAQKNQGRKN